MPTTNPAHLRKLLEIARAAETRFAGTEAGVKATALVAEIEKLLATVSP